jgi:O-acetyl-ADP-ribose deacetylase (regulator of RNase III)
MKIIHGNLITLAEQGKFQIIVHGCNCFNTMGGGIARQLADKYPEVKEIDSRTISGDREKLGRCTMVKINTGQVNFTVVNAYTQYEMSNTKDVFEYNSFEEFLFRFSQILPNYTQGVLRKVNVGFPKIGAGLAGGDWGRIFKMIEKFSDEVKSYANVGVVIYNQN